MALFRSDILNRAFFQRAIGDAEKTKSVDVLEITVGETKRGLQEIVPVHVTAEIRGRPREFSWTAKISPASPAAAALSFEMKLWEREVFIYKELLPAIEIKSNKLHLSAPPHPDLVYSELKDISSVGSELNPSCNAILLTDLSLAGFEPGNSGCEAEFKTIEMLFAQLARFHAHSFDFVSKSSDSDVIKVLHDEVPLAGKNIYKVDGLSDLLESLQPLSEDYSSRIKSLFNSENYFNLCKKVFGPREDKMCTVCHGSAWLENTMMWTDKDMVMEVIFVNYQFARYCQPATDLATLLYTSTSKKFRTTHLSSLLRSYHRTLTETLTTLGQTEDVYPFSDLFHDYQEAIIPAVGIAVTVLPGLVRESPDEVDTSTIMSTSSTFSTSTADLGDDRPGVAAGRLAADKIRDIMEELVETGIM